MTPIEILENVVLGTVVTDWHDIIPLGHPQYWQLSNVLEVFARLDRDWTKVGNDWYKLTVEQRRQRKRFNMIVKYYTLLTEPWFLETEKVFLSYPKEDKE